MFAHSRFLRRGVYPLLVCLLLVGSLISPLSQPVAFASLPNNPNAAPIPLTPAFGATITPTDQFPLALPQFSWTSVPGATSYRIRISPNIAFSTITHEETTTNTTLNLREAKFADGTWYWQVRVESPQQSVYSSYMLFNKDWARVGNEPLLTIPADGANLVFYDDGVFSWEPVLGAAQYRFQIAASSNGFNAPIVNRTTLSTSIQPETKLANGTYYWRVIPIDPGNHDGEPSEVREFTINYSQAPVQISPENDTYPTFTPTFRWTAVRGASHYILQYATTSNFTSGITEETLRNTTWTPKTPIQNDQDYYWRVKAVSGNSSSAWSPTWHFRKQWYIAPTLLTPRNLYGWVRFPFFSWTPVPGAARYRIEVSEEIDFVTGRRFQDEVSNTFYGIPREYWGDVDIYYWRVTPLDSLGQAGTPATASYHNSYAYRTPSQIYPFYFYIPRTDLQPHEDRTAPLPVFMWHQLTNPYPTGGVFAPAYRLEVSTDPLLRTVAWSVDTENTSATPTSANNFQPVPGQDYYWRVHALDSIGGNLIGDSWSQVWKAHFDPARGLTPSTNPTPVLLRPTRDSESVEATPLFEWQPVQNADSYEIEISMDPGFSPPDDEAIVPFPAYTPTTNLALRDIALNPFGTYYWRVRAHTSAGWGEWSETWRFQTSSQSEWIRNRTPGNTANQIQVAADPLEVDVPDSYELTSLNVTQSADYWYFGFPTLTATNNAVFMLYLDLDRKDGSGASFDPEGYGIQPISIHRPEYAISIFKTTTAPYVSASQIAVYEWDAQDSQWKEPITLDSMQVVPYYSGGYIEVHVPNTAIGQTGSTQSFSVALFSVSLADSNPQDSVPSSPGLQANPKILDRFASVSERMNVVMPPSNSEGDPTTYSSLIPFFWDNPVGKDTTPTGLDGTTPWAGIDLQVYYDPQFTMPVPGGLYQLRSNTPYYAPVNYEWFYDLVGDTNYYWRLKPRYLDTTGEYFGAWSQGRSFRRVGFQPENLLVSVSFATPTFSWSRVEGAEWYQLQVDNDPSFANTEVDETTSEPSYTPRGTLSNGHYYWRVRVRRSNNVVNEWSGIQEFDLNLPSPTNLTPNDSNPLHVVHYAPTLCWQPILAKDATDINVLAAFVYHLQVARDPSFSQMVEELDTEQSCWTPVQSYEDRTYYWRVAMKDGEGRMGAYSTAATFTKQYPITSWQTPSSGSSRTGTPTFAWGSVAGAAGYWLEIATDSDYTQVIDRVFTNNTRWTPTREYASNQTYYWRVAIVDLAGRVGPYSQATIILGGSNLYLPMTLDK